MAHVSSYLFHLGSVVGLYPQIERAFVDSIQLEQVIMNLMLNARDARELLPLNTPR